MRVLLAFAVGYAIGARGGPSGFDEVVRSAKAIKDADEVKDFVTAVRSHAGYTLRELAARLESVGVADDDDIVSKVRNITGRD